MLGQSRLQEPDAKEARQTAESMFAFLTLLPMERGRPRSSQPEGRGCGTLPEVARAYRCSKLHPVCYASRVYRQHDKVRPQSLSSEDNRGHTTKSFLRQKLHFLMHGPIRARNLRT